MDTMMIFVKSLTAKTIALETDLSESVAGLRAAIQVQPRFEHDMQHELLRMHPARQIYPFVAG